MNALSSMNFKLMKQVQDDTSVDKIEKMMDDFLVEVSILQSQKRANSQREVKAQREANTQRSTSTQQSSSTALQSSSWIDLARAVAYKFVTWGWLF